jgi:hypothetical protein
MATCSIAYLSTHITERFRITSEGAWACQGFERLVSLMMGRIGRSGSQEVMELRRALGVFPFCGQQCWTLQERILFTVLSADNEIPRQPDPLPSECKYSLFSNELLCKLIQSIVV